MKKKNPLYFEIVNPHLDTSNIRELYNNILRIYLHGIQSNSREVYNHNYKHTDFQYTY